MSFVCLICTIHHDSFTGLSAKKREDNEQMRYNPAGMTGTSSDTQER